MDHRSIREVWSNKPNLVTVYVECVPGFMRSLALSAHKSFLECFYHAMPLVQGALEPDQNVAQSLFSEDTDPNLLQTVTEILQSSHLQMSAVYWAATAYYLLNSDSATQDGSVLLPMKEAIVSLLWSCFTTEGGFSPAPGEDAHLLSTYSAIQVSLLYGIDLGDTKASIVKFIQSLQEKTTGAFYGDEWGEIDTRFSYCAIASLFLLGGASLLSEAIDLDKAIEHVESCCNLDGGYGASTDMETHAGQVFCCLATLTISGRLYSSIVPDLGVWLSQRQCTPDGGLNGRPEKLQDVCYSWWVLSSISMLQYCSNWIDKGRLIDYILSCQDEKRGGFSDRPGNVTDLFHTLFALTGLSLLGYKGERQLADIDPVFCLPKRVLSKIR